MKVLPADRKTGALPPVADTRIPVLGTVPIAMRAPADTVDWFAAVGDWPLLLNDVRGDCYPVAALHCIQQAATYAGTPLVATDAEADANYQAINHWTPTDTDQEGPGTVALGPGGLIEYWHTTGLKIGGETNRCLSIAQVDITNATLIRQGIETFGGLLCAITLTESMYQEPYLWDQIAGSVVSGHGIWIPGYETVAGVRYYEVITWGERLRMTEAVLLGSLREAFVVIDAQDMAARGVDGSGVPVAQLEALMRANFAVV